jgi:hypothetical protein
MLTVKNKNTKLSIYKILLYLPIILLASKVNAMKVEKCDKIDVKQTSRTSKFEEFIKKIIVMELGISNELSSKIDASKLLCDNTYHYFEKPKEILYAIQGNFIFGANSEEINNLSKDLFSNAKHVAIQNIGKFLLVTHIIYTSFPFAKHNVKVLCTENGDKLKEFYDVESFSVFGKNANF